MTALCPQSGKIRYASRLDAQDARAEWVKQTRRKQRVAKKVPMQIYQCVRCEGFHLTKVEARTRRTP